MKKLSLFFIVFSFFYINAQEKATILWDASASMNNRDLNKEFNYLNTYFTNNPNTETKLIVFGASIINYENYKIDAGNWDSIKNTLTNVDYDGATSYQVLNNNTRGEDILLFTDGIKNMDSEDVIFNGNLKIINSNPKFNLNTLKTIAKNNNGVYINLIDETKKVVLEEEYSLKLNGDSSFLDKIEVVNKNNKAALEIIKYGTYSIKGKKDDLIVFSRNGKILFEKN